MPAPATTTTNSVWPKIIALVVLLSVVTMVVAVKCEDGGGDWGWGTSQTIQSDPEMADRLREAEALLSRVYGPVNRTTGPETVNRYLLDPKLRDDIGEYLGGRHD